MKVVITNVLLPEMMLQSVICFQTLELAQSRLQSPKVPISLMQQLSHILAEQGQIMLYRAKLF